MSGRDIQGEAAELVLGAYHGPSLATVILTGSVEAAVWAAVFAAHDAFQADPSLRDEPAFSCGRPLGFGALCPEPEGHRHQEPDPDRFREQADDERGWRE